MLKRDLAYDFCEKYFDEASQQNFFSEVNRNSLRDHVYFTEKQLQILGEESKKTTRIIQGVGAISILGFIGFNQLPGVKNIQSRFVRVIVRLGLLVGPVLGVAKHQISSLKQVKKQVFEQQAKNYKDFLRCGDINKLKPNISFAQE